MKNYFKRFIKDEDGSEFIQFALILLIVAILAVVIYAIADSVKDKLLGAKDAIDALGTTSGGTGGTSDVSNIIV